MGSHDVAQWANEGPSILEKMTLTVIPILIPIPPNNHMLTSLYAGHLLFYIPKINATSSTSYDPLKRCHI
jgi:hypothetical protein